MRPQAIISNISTTELDSYRYTLPSRSIRRQMPKPDALTLKSNKAANHLLIFPLYHFCQEVKDDYTVFICDKC